MRYFFPYFYLFLFILPAQAVEITPNEVYIEIYKISQDINLLKQHFNIEKNAIQPETKVALYPRHVWQKTYQIMLKINMFREKNGLPSLSIISREPEEEMKPLVVYGQVIRIATEIDLLKRHFDIQTPPSLLPTFSNHTTMDNYDFLNHLSYEMDLLTGAPFNAQQVFAETIRVHDDISVILDALEVQDTTNPPLADPTATLEQTFQAVQVLLRELQRLQTHFNLDKLKLNDYVYSSKSINNNISETEVFSSLGIVLAELQPIKARLGLTYFITPAAQHYNDKQASDILRIIQWDIQRLKVIKF
ncbi:hypothetical protein [Beggiatoa leptomitoformis]|uniref:Uncharacterized protein n=1 Tax=Beggiatoa leptomitoformis TaxID=288004 RepID=A0A2N9YEY5_9GAMM|nr:hypothetical protein [Beggiatoa leptomitoformis]ALG68612.1 hypothetical protein AL038_14000 [Beggiatoa leptomitoformis]AUI69043.1 hypothetical protein BLE401_10255 [Beggiatoa leptomitoformis]